MTDQETRYVNDSIEAVVSKFRRIPNVFLTEDDLRVNLCTNLLRHFGSEERTQDNDISVSLHAEVRWYGKRKLKTRSDIVLIDVSNLEVLRCHKQATKGYRFGIPKGIIELKFRRPNGKSNASFLNDIQADIKKLNELKQEFNEDEDGQNKTEFWIVILDKKSRLEAVPEPAGIKLIYEFSNLKNPQSSNAK
jgi:hypothetical protein